MRTYGARYGYETEANAITGRGSAITIQDEATRTRVLRLRQDPYVAALMAGELIKRDRARIEQRIGRELRPPNSISPISSGRRAPASS